MPNFEQAGVAYRTNIQFQAQLQSHTVRGHRGFHCCDAGALVSASDLCDH